MLFLALAIPVVLVSSVGVGGYLAFTKARVDPLVAADAIVVLGGMGSQLGVILAAIVMILLPELMREFSEYRMLMFGALMVLMMIWRPQGLLPMQRPHMELRR